jgi:hypothetical protein
VKYWSNLRDSDLQNRNPRPVKVDNMWVGVPDKRIIPGDGPVNVLKLQKQICRLPPSIHTNVLIFKNAVLYATGFKRFTD